VPGITDNDVFGGKRFQSVPDLVSDSTERCDSLFMRTTHACGVIEAHVEMSCMTRKDRTAFPFVVAYCYDKIEFLSVEGIDGLRELVPDVYTDLGHHLHCFNSDCGWVGTSGIYYEPITSFVPQNSFSYLGPGRIFRAEEQNSFLVHTIPLQMKRRSFPAA
jgi:hypothetical protein